MFIYTRKLNKNLIFIFMCVFSFGFSQNTHDCNDDEMIVTNLGVTTPEQSILSRNSDTLTVGGNIINSKYLMVSLSIENVGSKSWSISIVNHKIKYEDQENQYDKKKYLLQTYGHDDFENNSRTLWTPRFYNNQVTMNFWSYDDNDSAKIKVNHVLEMPTTEDITPLYSTKIRNNADYQDILSSSDTKHQIFGRSVGLLLGTRGGKKWSCTGFFVNDNQFLTNFHCVKLQSIHYSGEWEQQFCENSIIDTSWDGDNVSQNYGCASLGPHNEELDLAIINTFNLHGSGKPQSVKFSSENPILGENLFVIHHPVAKIKQVSSEQCTATNTNQSSWKNASLLSEFHHTCDTEVGSSGAPMFNNEGLVVGVHHLGFEKDVNDVCDGRNKAINAEQVIKFLQENDVPLLLQVNTEF